MRFSQRKGLTPIRVELQRDNIDTVLRNKLWSALSIVIFERLKEYMSISELQWTFKKLWINFFGQPIDEMSDHSSDVIRWIREWFFSAKWHEMYDFIEELAKDLAGADSEVQGELIKTMNYILENEMSAYRFVGDEIGEITSSEEISAIEDALKKSKSLDPVYAHLKEALAKLTDRSNPDYRNSIKESISAVEAMCKLITRDQSATSGKALKELENHGVQLHPSLKKAWSNLYGFTSDASGIRHALTENSSITFGEAKYMLVSCSAFINYLIELATKSRIGL